MVALMPLGYTSAGAVSSDQTSALIGPLVMRCSRSYSALHESRYHDRAVPVPPERSGMCDPRVRSHPESDH